MSDPITRLNAALEGRYRIEQELGEGGMAVVYLAHDVKHERKVALKVLKPELAAVVGAERFLAEIKTTATLHHPHILPLFDSGEADGFLFYVMPYVEGETLKERIDREKQLPVEESTRIATAVAQALQHAHDRGVIHRDIKPANILFQDGQPLVSDFGIALAVGSAGGTRLTETGLSVGTPYYMSPEQATGDQHVGPPSDVYALAAVLYEMLTGDPPYMGSTAQAVLGQIIAGASVSATAKRRAVPPHLDAALRKGLEKLPADRFASAQDFARALADPGFRYGADTAGATTAEAKRWKAVAAALAAVALVATVAAGWAALRPEAPRQVRRYELALPDELPLSSGMWLRFTPDGSALLYTTPAGVALRRWDEVGASLTVRGPAAGTTFAVSPDGRDLAYVSEDTRVRTTALSGGRDRTLAELPNLAVWDWGSDGYVYFMPLRLDELTVYRAPADGSGSLEAVTQIEGNEVSHSLFELLPGGRLGLFNPSTAQGAMAGEEIWAVDVESRERWFVTEGVTPHYSLTGHLVFSTPEGTLMAASFDPDAGRLTGPPVVIAEDLMMSPFGSAAFALSPDGVLVYEESLGVARASGGTLQPLWVTRTGSSEVVDSAWTFELAGLGEAGMAGWVLSPDGTRVAASAGPAGTSDLWVKRLPNGPFGPITRSGLAVSSPFWLPNGQDVGFTGFAGSGLEGANRIFRARPDGAAAPEPFFTLPDNFGTVQIRMSPDGEWIVGRPSGPLGPGRDILAFRTDGDGETIPLVASPDFQEHGPDLSPDGALLAYSSDESGREEVYVRPFPEVNDARLTVSLAGGSNPKWAHNGRELFFIDAERRMNVVEIEQTPALEVVRREILFALEPDWLGYAVGDGGDDLYSVDVDDQRFLMGRMASGRFTNTAVSRLIVVENWLEEFRDQLGP